MHHFQHTVLKFKLQALGLGENKQQEKSHQGWGMNN